MIFKHHYLIVSDPTSLLTKAQVRDKDQNEGHKNIIHAGHLKCYVISVINSSSNLLFISNVSDLQQ